MMSTSCPANDGLAKLKQHIQELCDTYNITYPIQIIAVSKTIPVSKILELYTESHQTSFAENYVKEFSHKVDELPKDLEWHFIGNIQSNKIREISQKSSWVQSLEKIKHAELLNVNRFPTQPKLNVLIEVNISGEPNKHGLQSIDEIIQLADTIKQLPNLTLRGLMGVASNSTDESKIFQQFSYLKSIYDKLNITGYQLDTLSMGMSHDYPIAIKCGANMLRIGSRIFGERDYGI